MIDGVQYINDANIINNINIINIVYWFRKGSFGIDKRQQSGTKLGVEL
jgi:hypothetical protein